MAEKFKVGDVIQKRYGSILYIGYVTCVENGFMECITMALARNRLISLSMSNTYRLNDEDSADIVVLTPAEPSAPEQGTLITEAELEELRQAASEDVGKE